MLQISQIRQEYDIQKRQLDQKIVQDKTRHNKQFNNMIEEYEEKLKAERDSKDLDVEELKDELA